MLFNHLKFAIRVFLKDKFFSVLNILGLALGIGVSIILLLILNNDLNYDKHFAKANRIYRLGGHLQATGVDFRVARSARELGQILKDEFPEVEEVVRANSWDRTLVKYKPRNGEEKAFYEEHIVRTDSTYFQIFDHEFISGDPKSCLTDLNTLVLTQSTARRYFGTEDPIGKTLQIDNGDLHAQWKVTAVIKDVPENTHLKFDILLSRLIDREWVMDKGQIKSEAFWNPDVYTYLLLPENYKTENFYEKFPAIFDKYYKSFGDQIAGKYTPILESLSSIHFHSKLDSDEPQGNLAYVYAFTAIGIFIALLACINYMNLSTAKAVGRATEIAMKKTLGSGKRILVLAFFGESVFLSVISLLLAVGFVYFVLNATSFNVLVGRNLTLDFVKNPGLLFGSLSIAVMIGLISGIYPAFYLPQIPALQAMKGSFKNRKSSRTLRRALTILQFTISMFVVVCTWFMRDQINYVRNQSLGFDKENVLVVPILDTVVQKQVGAIKHEFLQNPHIHAATTSYNVIGLSRDGSVMWAEGERGMQQQAFSLMYVGDDFMTTMGMKLLRGRDFVNGSSADTDQKFIVNEAAVKLMGWGGDPIGKKVKYFHAEKDGEVIGVVKNFNFSSLHNAIEPLLLVKARDEGGNLFLRLQGNLPETIEFVKKRWQQMDTNHPFEYFFLDQKFNEQYKADETQYQLLSVLSYICIFISLLGLLGLSAFTAAQRTKEIGIRKVHGAAVSGIIYLLYKEVMVLVLIATVVVVPVSYWMIMRWLGGFAYQVPLNYFTFATVCVLALAFAFLTVAFHSLKTARTNPVESLKYE
jgi:putative ABC transport system permease protein